MTKKLLMIIKITMLISVLFFASCNSSSDPATPSGKENTGNDTTITDASCTFVFTPGEDIGNQIPTYDKTDGTCSVEGGVATWKRSALAGNSDYTASFNQANGTFKYIYDADGVNQLNLDFPGTVTVSDDGKRWEWKSSDSTGIIEITGDTSGGDISGGDTAIGEVIGTAEGKVLSKDLGFGRNTYDGVTSMTCTLEVEEVGKSPITYNGICDKNNVEGFIAFYDKEDNPSVSARLTVPHNQYPAEEIEYSEAEAIKEKNPTATTKVSRENNVWEGKITDGGTDLLKLTITTEDIVVAAPADSKPCQFVNKIIGYVKINNYTLDGNCVLARDANDAVTKLDFTSSLANPAVIISLPIGKSDEISSDNPDNRSQFKDTYLIGDYLYQVINSLTTIDFNDNKNNTFTAKMSAANGVASEFDIVLK